MNITLPATLPVPKLAIGWPLIWFSAHDPCDVERLARAPITVAKSPLAPPTDRLSAVATACWLAVVAPSRKPTFALVGLLPDGMSARVR